MATYEIDITKRLMKTVVLTVPDHVPEEDAKEWASENIDELFDIEGYQGTEKWEDSTLQDGETLPVELSAKDEDRSTVTCKRCIAKMNH